LIVSSFAWACADDPIEPMNNPPPPPELVELVPLPRAFLDRAYTENNGLLTGAQPDGNPHRFGEQRDSLVDEARRFYDTLGAPGNPLFPVDYSDPFSGTSTPSAGMRETAPSSFELWKETYGFEPRLENESLEDYRARTDVVVYYNRNELGLGRELGCHEFADGVDGSGNPLTGMACFVTNYGVAFNDRHNSLQATIDGENPKNTVCITYRPSMEETYQVQFYVYGPTGARQEWAQLDTYGARPVPHICMNCHGGNYDEEKHLAKNARFLPMDPNVLIFDESPNASVRATRAGQEESMRKVNLYSMMSPLTGAQVEYFNALYDNKLSVPGQKSLTAYIPPGWKTSPEASDFFAKVVHPHCGTCHLADQFNKDGQEQKFYKAYGSIETFLAEDMLDEVCGSLAMPNAQPTQRSFWRFRDEPITVGAKTYDSPATAFLDMFGATYAECNEDLESISDCRAFPDPDALCGNDVSGTACDRTTGQCVPMLDELSPVSATEPTGFCRADGTRGCVFGQECRPANVGIATYDGECVTCGRLGYGACTSGAPCNGEMVERNGVCARP
jgi:hypothetical protein